MSHVDSRSTYRRWLAWLAVAVALAGAVSTLVGSPAIESALSGAMFVTFAVVGLILETRAADNGIGRILLAIGALAGVGGIAAAMTELAPPDSGLAATGRWLETWLVFPVIGLILPLLLVFPTGRLLSRRWRWVVMNAPLFVGLASVGAALYPWSPTEGGPNPLAVESKAQLWLFLQDISGIPILVGALGGIASVVVRYRRAGEIERHQIKWFMTATALLPIAIAIGDEYREIQGVIVPLTFSLFPVAIGVAITRYRLYDIDQIVSRTVSYAIISALLVGAYVAVVFVLRLLFPGDGQLAVVASTLASAALFSPVRRRVQEVVDRRFNRSRYDATRVVEGFGERIRSERGIEDLSGDLVAVVGRTMQPETASMWLRDPSG